MGEHQKEKALKRIVEKFRFIDLDNIELESLKSKFRELYQECKRLAIERDIAVETMQIYSLHKEKKVDKPQIKYSQYNPDWGGIEKIAYILRENARLMKSEELIRELLQLEPSFGYTWGRIHNVGGRYIYRAVKFLLVVKYKKGNRFVYGLPEWFDGEGRLLALYQT